MKNSRKRTEKTGTENGKAYGHSRLMVGRISVIDMSAIPKFEATVDKRVKHI